MSITWEIVAGIEQVLGLLRTNTGTIDPTLV
jgi:hypothetical protein